MGSGAVDSLALGGFDTTPSPQSFGLTSGSNKTVMIKLAAPALDATW